MGITDRSMIAMEMQQGSVVSADQTICSPASADAEKASDTDHSSADRAEGRQTLCIRMK